MVAGFFTLCGVAATLWFNSKQRRAEAEERARQREEDYREWYTRTLFEKRLAAVQEGYAWLMRLNAAINLAGPGQPGLEENADLRRICAEARQWYDRNALYLYDDLPSASAFIGLTNAAFQYATSTRPVSGIWQLFSKAEALIKGRAKEMLDVERKRGTNNGR